MVAQASDRGRRRGRVLAAAVMLLPTPAMAAVYYLSGQTVNLAGATYTADDTLNISSVTFTSSISNATLPAALNLYNTTLVTGSGNITLAGSLAGTGTLNQAGTGSLTLTSASPSFTGPVNISSGTLRLADPAALGLASAPTPITFAGTLDVSGALPVRPLYFSSSTSALANNTTTPVTLGPSLSLTTSTHGIILGGTGDITFLAPLPTPYIGITKSGTGTVTYGISSQISTGYGVAVSAGTLRLGIESPFAGSTGRPLTVSNGAMLDLNGFNSPGIGISVSSGGLVVNNNTAVTSTLPTLPGGTLTLGGTGDINLTAKVGSLTKTGTGTLSLSAANTTFGGTLTINDGTLRLNNAAATGTSATHFVLNSTAVYNGNNVTYTAAGTLDLNGYPAPAGNYTFGANTWLVNNNTSSPSIVGTNVTTNGTPLFNGDGEIIYNLRILGTAYRFGTGTLTLNYAGDQLGTINSYSGGILRLGNPATNAYSGAQLNIYGYFSYQPHPDHYSALDLNGRSSTPANVTLYYNSGIVNNNTSTPATLDGTTFITYSTGNASVYPPFHAVLGGDGTLNVTSTFPYGLVGRAIDKVGAGLLTLPNGFNTLGVNLFGGTLQAETNGQLGGKDSTIAFYGGTLRIAPLYVAPQSSYTFTPFIAVDPSTGGILDTQRDSTFAGLLTGSGAFSKVGTASATLNPHPSSRLALNIQAGALRLRPAAGTPVVTSLAIASGGSLDVADSLVVDYAGASPLGAVRQYIASGQLTSAAATPDQFHTLAYAEAADLLGLSGSQTAVWSDQTIDSTAILIAPALYGDANLDGTVTPDDYALLDRSFALQLPNPDWTDGDFNHDGIIDASDYLLIDTALGQAHGFSPGFLAERESQFGSAYVQQLLTSLPEPSSPLACLFAGLLLYRRKSKQIS